ncbi:hypothetical protein ACN4DW_01370 [Corynebacterium macclintockiae]|uniref:hypothetical protein n=1 Tax=Corynebacterium TaxID=1716 RepID=UPI000552B0FA|nr:hypothetical protein [Corynebacterium sp. LK28]MBC6795454.1 hypothetical protein [Corynebacterium sp. LK28]
MGIFNFGKSGHARDEAAATADLIHQAQRAPYPSGPIARRFFGAIDRTVSVQEPLIRSYVANIEKRHGDASLQRKQEVLDTHFKNLATGSGAGTGGVAAVPGVGTLLSLAGITAESALLVEVCALYALASAELHGIDISKEETRRAVVYLAISGATAKEPVQAIAEDNTFGSLKAANNLRGTRKLRDTSSVELKQANNVLGRFAFRQVRKRFGGAMFKKVLPFGVGAYLGAKANRKIAEHMIDNVHVFIREADKIL